MLSTFGLQGRTAALHVYAPKEYETLFKMEMDLFCGTMDYKIVFHGIDTHQKKVIYEDRSMTIETVPLIHRMPCCGFIFREKAGLRHIKPEMMKFYNIPLSQADNLRHGMDWTSPDGEVIPNARLTTDPDAVRSYAYMSDTRYMPSLKDELADVTTLYHEATYCEDMKCKAVKYLHSTAREAATTARDSGVKQLIIGHFSQRYIDETPLLEEAKEVFQNTLLADEGKVFDV